MTPVFDYLVRAGRVGNVFSMQLCGTVDKGRKLDVSTGGTMVQRCVWTCKELHVL